MIRAADRLDAEVLTGISFASKRYWGYPEKFFKVWSNELTITPDYIKQNDVYLHETGTSIVGYYSIVRLADDLELSGIALRKGFWLEHMFVKPESIGKGVGTELFHHLRQSCKTNSITELGILSDPHARGFYEKMGCLYVGEYPSTITNRTTPYLTFRQ